MDARRYPRIKTSFLASLMTESGSRETRPIENISENGFFVSGSKALKLGQQCQLTMSIPGATQTLTLAARVVHIDETGCGLAFDSMDRCQSELLSNRIKPRWDGRDILEGVIIHGILENTSDLASSLRLTTLLSSNYRRASRAAGVPPEL